MDTNANLVDVATALDEGRRGTFSSLIIQKKGKALGKGSERKVYGDDFVHVVMVTGFDYGKLVERSLDILAGTADDGVKVTNKDVLDYIQERGLTGKDGSAVTLKDVQIARRELVVGLSKSVAGLNKEMEDNYEPLVVDGHAVRGAKVYVGEDKPEVAVKTKADAPPTKGTIYLSGLKISEKVLRASPNGKIPPTNSKAVTVAKNVLRRMLPVGRYVSFALEPGKDFVLKVGGSAAVAATQGGLGAEPVVMREIRRLLS